ncbi:hypothetical protein AVEN_5771-1 [Araneus ventricosus]|uniref:Uncharacterized protein n=1 Tax=Araneus ventricosus TaxID=182803 RepID=A0A4Y2DZ66_ARAVE|nr:hypothetical protein AVEN_5771-1 [Araneus ventricosus]
MASENTRRKSLAILDRTPNIESQGQCLDNCTNGTFPFRPVEGLTPSWVGWAGAGSRGKFPGNTRPPVIAPRPSFGDALEEFRLSSLTFELKVVVFSTRLGSVSQREREVLALKKARGSSLALGPDSEALLQKEDRTGLEMRDSMGRGRGV